MMMLLTDDRVLWIFDSPTKPPDWIEAIDIENEEYRFSDHRGQRFVGIITTPIGRFARGAFELRPDGQPDLNNAFELVDGAVSIESNEAFVDLASLRRHLASA